MSRLPYDVRADDLHDKASVVGAEDIDVSEVRVLEVFYELEGVGTVDGVIAHLKLIKRY
jgi:hypothetical protein